MSNPSNEVSFFYITTQDRNEASRIGRALVEARLAACVNILDSMQSIYYWDDSIQESNEAVLIVKTRHALSDSIVNRVKELHSYKCPCIVELPIAGGSSEYLQWIRQETNL